MNETPREILARADQLRRTARAAETMRTRIRLFEKPVLRRGGLLGFRKKEEWHPDHVLSPAETDAVYEALADVRNRMDAEADRLEARVAEVSR